MIKSRSYFYCGFATTLNIILNALTFGRYLWLEGRVRGDFFRNWARQFGFRPARFVQPETEAEIVALVKNSTKLRVFGSAHSFNGGVVAEGATLVSLDKYCGAVETYLDRKQIRFRGGTRVRDVIRTLSEHGLAFAALPSHDAQSIAGILSTDVHGTGKGWGFVSECVVGLKIIDGTGAVHECQPPDDLFKAAIGGVGAVGIIAEVVVQAVERFSVEQKFELVDLAYVRANLDRLLDENTHLSLYIFPFADVCQISTWNVTDKPHSPFGTFREFVAISFDALSSAWFGNLMAYTGFLPSSNSTYGIKRGTNLVMESHESFNRTIYHLHQELEFTVPFEETWAMCDRFLDIYEQMYSKSLPYALLEVRFTPAGHERTFLGAGRSRRSTWIDLICNDSHGFEDYYRAAEEEIKKIGARPHLGKYCQSLDKGHLSRVHGAGFSRFLELMREHDPEDKFANEFTSRLFR